MNQNNKERLIDLFSTWGSQMLGDELNNLTKKSRKVLGTNWISLPNCSDFKIKLSELDFHLYSIGVKKRLTPKITIEAESRSKKNMNEYMEFQIRRLRKHKANPRKFWKIADWLIRNSTVFRCSAIYHVFPNWHRKLPIWWIIRVNDKANKIIDDKDTNLDFKRVYIPKSETFRPLGVPKPEWRLYLHMLSNMLYIFVEDHILPSQHGYVPGKGTLTAWKDIFERKLVDKPYIYEFDLKGFFDNIHVNKISKVLFDYNTPKAIVYRLENINRNNPKLPAETKLDEGKTIMSEQDQDDIMRGYFRWESKLYDPVREFVGANGVQILYDLMREDGIDNIFEYVQMQWALFDQYSPAKVPNQFEGVPQGAPTSPLLSILALKEFLSQQESVSYADDGIFFGDRPFEIKDDTENGIILNKEKSHWVKFEGRWLKPLKFLGLEYDGKTLRANTREGSKLELPEHLRDQLILRKRIEANLWKDIEWQLDTPYPFTWHELFTTKLIGLVQARMYSGTFNLGKLEQDFRLTYGKNSWVSYHDKKDGRMTVFNSSSFASTSLNQILRNKERKRRGLRWSCFKFASFKVYKQW